MVIKVKTIRYPAGVRLLPDGRPERIGHMRWPADPKPRRKARRKTVR